MGNGRQGILEEKHKKPQKEQGAPAQGSVLKVMAGMVA